MREPIRLIGTVGNWKVFMAGVACAACVGGSLALAGNEYIASVVWPAPPVVVPGTAGGPPSDAIVLFDGKDMVAWKDADTWIVKDGCVTAGGHDISTRQAFGDCQLHVEWATPKKVVGQGQGRGNSGVFLMGCYEIQVLDSYQNDTYYDGQAAAVYKQHPPMVNVCRKPGEWQTYDIVWEAPHFDAKGQLLKPAYVTVFQNGVVVQNHFELTGRTLFDQKAAYTPLQYHNNPVRYRNLWIREIKEIKGHPGTNVHHPH